MNLLNSRPHIFIMSEENDIPNAVIFSLCLCISYIMLPACYLVLLLACTRLFPQLILAKCSTCANLTGFLREIVRL